MKVNMRNYINDNLLIVEIFSDKEKLKNIFVIAYSDDKRDILLKKVVFNDISHFVDRIDYNILDICEEIVNAYGDGSDFEKLWLANRIFGEIIGGWLNVQIQ